MLPLTENHLSPRIEDLFLLISFKNQQYQGPAC